MKFTIERDTLARAVAAASRTVSSKSTLAFLEGLCVEAGEETIRLTGYNLETGITVTEEAQVREAGSCIMPCRMFSDIVRKLQGDTVSVEVDKDYRVRVQGGGATFKFLALNAEDYPALPAVQEENEIRLPQMALRALIDGTVFAVSFDGGAAGNPTLTGCLIETEGDRVHMVGCDGYRLAVRSWQAEDAQFPVMQAIVAATGLKELEKILEADGDKEVSVSTSKTHASFRTEGTTVICRLIEGKYLEWRRFVQDTAQIQMIADTAELTAAVERVALIVSEKYKAALRCRFGRNSVELTTTTTIASATDGCQLVGDGQETEIAFSSRYLLEALKNVPEENVTLLITGGLRPVLLVPIEGPLNWCYMINPVRTVPGQK